MRRSLWTRIVLAASSIASLAFAAAWPPEARFFLEGNTFPTSEWRADDFGRDATFEDRRLLERFLPRVWIGPNAIPPIDFYRDYLPRSSLYDGASGEARPVDRAMLKSVERDPKWLVRYQGDAFACRGEACRGRRGILYGRVHRESLAPPEGGASRDIVILKYSAVFAVSGLPARLPWYKEWGARLLGDPEVWHQLDIHGSIQLLFEPGNDAPFALLLAQHNHFRSYLVGRQLSWPADGRVRICFAERSNEPYPCPPGGGVSHHRAIGSPADLRYLVLGGREPIAGGIDVVHGKRARAVEIPCDLQFLPDRDPLYVSWIPLGARFKLLGIFESFYRQGPPGMDVYSHPAMRRYGDLVQFFYFEDGDEDLAKLVEATVRGFRDADFAPVLLYNGKRFWRDWIEPRPVRDRPSRPPCASGCSAGPS